MGDRAGEEPQLHCMQLRAQAAQHASELQWLSVEAERAERQKRDFGRPLLEGAIVSTQARSAALWQEGARLQVVTHDSMKSVAQAERQTLTSVMRQPELTQASENLEQRLAAEQAENTMLRNQLRV